MDSIASMDECFLEAKGLAEIPQAVFVQFGSVIGGKLQAFAKVMASDISEFMKDLRIRAASGSNAVDFMVFRCVSSTLARQVVFSLILVVSVRQM
jgi:hypothetical protein